MSSGGAATLKDGNLRGKREMMQKKKIMGLMGLRFPSNIFPLKKWETVTFAVDAC